MSEPDYKRIFSSMVNGYQLYDTQSYGNKIYVAGRQIDGKKFNYCIKDFKPYFFIPKQEPKYFLPFLPLKQCTKVTLDHPKEMRDARSKYKYTYEGDILYDIRFHTDTMINYPSNRDINPRIWMWDIEVFRNFELGQSNPLNQDHVLNTISFHDNYLDEVFTIFVIDKRFHTLDSGVKKVGNQTVIFVNNERDLFIVLIKLLKKFNPDILSSWNGVDFDMPFLCKRAETFHKDIYKHLSPYDIEPHMRTNMSVKIDEWFIRGFVHLDYMLLYKKYQQNKRESYALDFVCDVELGYGKVDYDGSLDELYKNDPIKYIEYSKQDVTLLNDIEQKLMYILLVNEMKEISASPMQYFNHRNTTKLVDSLICKYIRSKPEPLVMKSKTISDGGEDSTKFSGAFVKKPVIGFHNWIIDLDATGMYPSIMRTLNISPETFICKMCSTPEEITDVIRPYMFNRISEINIKDIKIITNFGIQKTIDINQLKNGIYSKTGGQFSIATNGAVFNLAEVGIIPDIQEILSSGRDDIKSLKKLWDISNRYCNIKYGEK